MLRVFLRPLPFAAIVLATVTTAVHAEGSHHFDIHNGSSKTITISRTIERCIEHGKEVNWPQTIASGETYRVYWDDSNSIYDYGGYGCINKDKFVAFSISIDGGDYDGYLGITHRRLSGSKWYNGQFYAQDITVYSNGTINGTDGPSPPGYIFPECTNNNDCFGPWSEMEMDNKNSYNWPRSFQTEDGWAFSIGDPVYELPDTGLGNGGGGINNCKGIGC